MAGFEFFLMGVVVALFVSERTKKIRPVIGAVCVFFGTAFWINDPVSSWFLSMGDHSYFYYSLLSGVVLNGTGFILLKKYIPALKLG